MTHDIGDLVASYTDAALKKIEVGWITEIVYESIWIAHVEHSQPAYRIHWCTEEEPNIFLHNENDILDMKNLYEEWHR